jgi:hypothetical protein
MIITLIQGERAQGVRGRPLRRLRAVRLPRSGASAGRFSPTFFREKILRKHKNKMIKCTKNRGLFKHH